MKHWKQVFWIGLLILFINWNPLGLLAQEASFAQPVQKTFRLGGSPVEVKLTLSASTLTITDYLTMTIDVEASQGVIITPVYLYDLVYAPFRLVEIPLEEEKLLNKASSTEVGKWRYRYQYKLEPQESGKFSILPFEVQFRLSKEKPNNPDLQWKSYVIQTEAIPVEVTSITVDLKEDIRDIKGQLLPPFQYLWLWLAIGTILLLNLLLYLFWRFWLNRPKGQVLEEEEQIDYYFAALNALQNLESQDLIGLGKIEQFHEELCEILRSYLEYHCKLKAKEQSSEEFLQEIAYSQRFTGEQKNTLNEYLCLSDLVKFASFQPEIEVNQKAVKAVKKFIEATGESVFGEIMSFKKGNSSLPQNRS